MKPDDATPEAVEDLDEVSRRLEEARELLDEAIARRRQLIREHEAEVHRAAEQLRHDGRPRGIE